MQFVRFEFRVGKEQLSFDVPLNGINDIKNQQTYKKQFCVAENTLLNKNVTEPEELSFDQYMVWTVPGNAPRAKTRIVHDPNNGFTVFVKLIL